MAGAPFLDELTGEAPYGPRLDGAGYTDTLYSYLWKRHNGKPCPSITLPHTIIYKYGSIAQWIYTASDGQLERKRKTHLKNDDVYETLCASRASAGARCEVVAQYIKPIPRDDGTRGWKLQIEYFDKVWLKEFLETRPKDENAILQGFVDPWDEHNTLIRAFWSPTMLHLDRRENLNSLQDTRYNPFERCCTFDGGSHLSRSVPARDARLIQSINHQLHAVYKHVLQVLPTQCCSTTRFRSLALEPTVLLHCTAM